MLNVKSLIIAAIAGLLFGAGGAWVAQDWRYGVRIERNAKDAAEGEAARAKKVADDYRKLQVERDDWARKVAQIDGDYTGKLNALQTENNRLADCVRTSKCGMRIAATCTNQPGRVPAASGAPGAASVDDAGACRLTPTAEQDYLALRGAMNTQRLQLEGLQSYVRELQYSCQKAAAK